MRRIQPYRSCAAVLVCLALILQPVRAAHAAGPPAASTPVPTPKAEGHVVRDVALGRGGILRGQVVDPQGRPQPGLAVVLRQPGGEVGRATSDEEGRFRFTRLRGGLYHVSSGVGQSICRLWAAETAPPAATDQLLVVSGNMVQRGQRPFGELLRAPPVILALVIAAAIAIPVAVFNQDDKAGS